MNELEQIVAAFALVGVIGLAVAAYVKYRNSKKSPSVGRGGGPNDPPKQQY